MREYMAETPEDAHVEAMAQALYMLGNAQRTAEDWGLYRFSVPGLAEEYCQKARRLISLYRTALEASK